LSNVENRRGFNSQTGNQQWPPAFFFCDGREKAQNAQKIAHGIFFCVFCAFLWLKIFHAVAAQ